VHVEAASSGGASPYVRPGRKTADLTAIRAPLDPTIWNSPCPVLGRRAEASAVVERQDQGGRMVVEPERCRPFVIRRGPSAALTCGEYRRGAARKFVSPLYTAVIEWKPADKGPEVVRSPGRWRRAWRCQGVVRREGDVPVGGATPAGTAPPLHRESDRPGQSST